MNIYKRAVELEEENRPFVIATVISSEGSVPGKVGFKMLVEDENHTFGTVGGGAIEKQVIIESISLIQNGVSGSREYLLSDNAIQENVPEKVIPMMCSGKVTIFYEVHGEKSDVYVFGGGHVGQALLYFLKPLGFHTILIDNRQQFANRDTNPDASECILSDYLEYVNKFSPGPQSYAVIVTHGHRFDNDILKILYKRKLKLQYIGVISSKAKAERLIEGVTSEYPDSNLSILHTPIGLNIGGNSSAEIALAIAAEIQAVKNGKLEGNLVQASKI